jgi:hypothetical protein
MFKRSLFAQLLASRTLLPYNFINQILAVLIFQFIRFIGRQRIDKFLQIALLFCTIPLRFHQINKLFV